MLNTENKADTLNKEIENAQKGISQMTDAAMTPVEAVKALGSYINSIEKANADKINEMDENLKKTKLAANLGATFAALLGIGLGGYVLYNKYNQNGAEAMATGETF